MKGFIIPIIVLLSACVDPFNYTVKNPTEYLVIEGRLSDRASTHQVTLSTSGALYSGTSSSVNYVSGATVWAEDSQGNRIVFAEADSGIYRTKNSAAGVVGETYILHVETSEGRVIRSSPELLNPGIPMDSIYGRYIERASTENDQSLKGVQLFIDTQNIGIENISFRYQFSESYEIQVPYPSKYILDFANRLVIPRTIPVDTCYRTNYSTDIIVASTEGTTDPLIREMPIRYILDEDDELLYQYQITVTQYTISSRAYQFYKTLKINNESSGSFFDTQKGIVYGNMTDVNDSDEPVLGYFEVGGTVRSTKSFRSSDFIGFFPTRPDNCQADQVLDRFASDSIFNLIQSDHLLYDYVEPERTQVLTVKQGCGNCTLYGTSAKPNNWIDD